MSLHTEVKLLVVNLLILLNFESLEPLLPLCSPLDVLLAQVVIPSRKVLLGSELLHMGRRTPQNMVFFLSSLFHLFSGDGTDIPTQIHIQNLS